MDPPHIVAIQNKKIFQHLSHIRHELNGLSAGTRRFLDELVLAALEVEYPAVLLKSAARPGGGSSSSSSSSNGRLVQEARFWRWQIAALLARAHEAVSGSEQRLVRATWAVDSESNPAAAAAADADPGRVEREYDRVLGFVDGARTAVRACKEVVDDWNQDRLAAAMDCCEHLYLALCGFPDVAVPAAPEALRQCPYEPAAAGNPGTTAELSWPRRRLEDIVRRRARHNCRPWGYWRYSSPLLYLAMASCAYWTGLTYLHWPRILAHDWWFTVH